MKTWKFKLQLITEEFFQFSLITYLILLLAETFKEGVVSSFFNLTILLVIVLINGLTLVLLHNDHVAYHPHPQKRTKLDNVYTIILTIGGVSLVYDQTMPLGDIALLIACITGLIIFLLSFLLSRDKSIQ